MIRLDRLTVRYGDRPAVEDLSLTVAPGGWTGLIGPNGAGKSTVLRALAGLVPHDGGATVDGRAVSGCSRRQLARVVALVPQQPELPRDMAVADYVLLGRSAHVGWFGTESAGDVAACEAVLARLDLGELAARLLHTLSGGELQRVVLARALAQEAPVLLLDEPTSALDLGRQVQALELIDELRVERGLAVLSAMHDLTLAGQFADHVCLLQRGCLVAAGAPADVLTEATLSAHYGADVRVVVDDGVALVLPRRRRPAADRMAGCAEAGSLS